MPPFLEAGRTAAGSVSCGGGARANCIFSAAGWSFSSPVTRQEKAFFSSLDFSFSP
jgi:hypothetical protein